MSKYIRLSISFYEEDMENIEKVQRFFGYKTRSKAVRKAIEEMVRKNAL